MKLAFAGCFLVSLSCSIASAQIAFDGNPRSIWQSFQHVYRSFEAEAWGQISPHEGMSRQCATCHQGMPDEAKFAHLSMIVARVLSDCGPLGSVVLRKNLTHEKPAVRIASAVTIGKTGYKPAVPDLVELLEDRTEYAFSKTKSVRAAALVGLAELGSDQKSLPILLSILKEGYENDQPLLVDGVAKNIAALGSAGRRALPMFARRQCESVAVARAMALAAPGTRLGLIGVRSMLRKAENEQRHDSRLFDLIVELGPSAQDIIPQVRALAMNEDLASIRVRIDSAFVMANREPNELKWRKYLESIAKDIVRRGDKEARDYAAVRLQTLPR